MRRDAALAWNLWEERASKLMWSPNGDEDCPIDQAIAIARIEAHYFVNGSFFIPGNQLLRDATRIAHIPGVIVQGRYDIVCPASSAWELHKAWPLSRLELVADAGHAADETGTAEALVRAMEEFKEPR
jgi:proline iminopeptidase